MKSASKIYGAAEQGLDDKLQDRKNGMKKSSFGASPAANQEHVVDRRSGKRASFLVHA